MSTKYEDNRKEHLDWCKKRALEYVSIGDYKQAFNSMHSDLGKWPDTRPLQELSSTLGLPLMAANKLSTKEQMTRWIEGFN